METDSIAIRLRRTDLHRARRSEKYGNILHGVDTSAMRRDMPNQPAFDKVVVSYRLDRVTAIAVEKAAKAAGKSRANYLRDEITAATADIELNPEDYEQAARETREARDAWFAKHGAGSGDRGGS